MWGILAKQLLKTGVKKVATDKLLNRKKKKTKKRTSGKKVSDGIMSKENGGKGGSLAVKPSTGLVPSAKDFAPISTTPGESDIVIIKKQVIQVRDILKDTHTAKQAERVDRKKTQKAQKREKIEDKLEKPKVKPKEMKAKKVPKGMGIGNFFSWLAFGIILNKLIEFLPSLKKIARIIKPIAKFIIGVFEKTIGFVVGFIDIAYAGVEKLEEGVEAIGGEGAKELFNKFGRLFTQLLNGALIAAMVAASMRRWRKPKKPDGKVPKPKWRKNLERWFKKTTPGKFIRNRLATLKKITREISRSPVGKIVNALRPKNVSKFIMEGGLDKTIKNVGGNLLEKAKNIQLPKVELPKVDLSKGRTGLFSGIGKRWNQATSLATKGKDFLVEGTLSNIQKGKDALRSMSKWLDDLGKGVVNAVKSVKWGELPGVKQFRGAFDSIKGTMGTWIDEVGKNLSPGKMIQGLLDQAKPTIDDVLAKNPALQKLGSKLDPKKFVPWVAENFQKFSKQAEPIAKAVKGNKALKSLSNFLGPLDIVVDSMFALIDYGLGKESLVNAIVKALSSTLGFAAGAAAGSALSGLAIFGTGGAFAPMLPYVTFAMGMGGAYAGEFLGNKILQGIIKIAPGLADIDDPLAEELGLGPRKILRDPFGDNKDDENSSIQSSNGNSNAAAGLDTQTSYGSDGLIAVENITTYIQPIEV